MASLEKVKPGQPYSPSSKAHNAFVDAAEYVQRLKSSTGRTPLRDNWQATILQAKNVSGYDCQRFDVLGIDSVFPTPAANLDAFKNGPILRGTTPAAGTHEGKFVVLLEPANNNKIVPACVAGVCVAKVNVTDAAHTHVDVKDGDRGSLASGPWGSALILWKETGTGVKWAVIRLGVDRRQARWIGFTVNDAEGFATTDESVTVDGVTYHDGCPPIDEVTTVYNTGWGGEDDQKGVALLDANDGEYYIVAMAPGATEDVLTDFQVDAENQKLQIKTRQMLIWPLADETEWTDKHTGSVCP